MAKLRLAAFEAEDADAARTWAANLGELKKKCFVGADKATQKIEQVEPCQVLATESSRRSPCPFLGRLED